MRILCLYARTSVLPTLTAASRQTEMFFHPIFKLILKKPELLVEHFQGYVALAREETSDAVTELVIKVAAWAAMAISGLLFVLLVAIALMLGAVNGVFHWVLVAVPAFFLIVCIGSFMWARRPLTNDRRFAELKAQVDADVEALRLAGSAR